MRDGWQQVTLGDVAKVVGGGTPKTSVPEYWGGDIPWITPTEVTAQDGQVVYRTERTLTDLGLSKSGAKLLPVGTVLLTSRATIGAAVLAGAPIATNQGFASLICGPEALPEFVMHWCRHNKERFIERAGGNTFLEVAKGKVASVPIDLPPLDEQRRIVDLIDSLDATIDAADRLVEEASVLYRSMLVERAGSLGDLRSVGELVGLAKAGGTPNRKRPDYFGGSVPWVKSGEVAAGLVLGAEESITEAGLASCSAFVVPAGSVVVAMYGATAGTVGMLGIDAATNQAVLALRGKPELVSNRYLFHALSAVSGEMKARATGAAQANLSKERVLEQQIPVPPLAEQVLAAELLDGVLEVAAAARSFAAALRTTRSAVLGELLSGEHEIPASYDELLGDVA